MARRRVLTERQRLQLFDLRTDPSSLVRYYTLGDDDLAHIRTRRREENRIGFALQLCALRFPGRSLAPGEVIPNELLDFIGAQLGTSSDALANYAVRRQTRQQHMDAIKRIYNYEVFDLKKAEQLKPWLEQRAELARTNEALVREFVIECRAKSIILPAIGTIERFCADALTAADNNIDARIAERIDKELAAKLESMIEEQVSERLTRFAWLRQKEPGSNSADATRLLDRYDYLEGLKIDRSILEGVPVHRVIRLKRQGERYFAKDIRLLASTRRLATLAVCAIEWKSELADALADTHQRVVGASWRQAKKLAEGNVTSTRPTIESALASFAALGTEMLMANEDNRSIKDVVERVLGWEKLGSLVATATHLTDPLASDPYAFASKGVFKFRRYAPRMARTLKFESAPETRKLLNAVLAMGLGEFDPDEHPFLAKRSRWLQISRNKPETRQIIFEVALWFSLRDAMKAGDIWLAGSRRYADIKEVLVATEHISTATALKIPLNPNSWVEQSSDQLIDVFHQFDEAIRTGALPKSTIRTGGLNVAKLKAPVPEAIEQTVALVQKVVPRTRITDILQDVDDEIGFTDEFVHLRTGAPCVDKIGLLTVLLSEGLNLGLSKMADAIEGYDRFQLMRLSRWHVDPEALDRALERIVLAQSRLPIAQTWGSGRSASADGQFFASARHGEAGSNLNAKYGRRPGVKAYTHVSDHYSPFATQTIPTTVSEAPYILDGLLLNETGRRVKEQYADTGGFTDHVFGAMALLGYRFVPRIRDLPSKKIYLPAAVKVPASLKPLVGGRLKEGRIRSNWPDLLRLAATMSNGTIKPSQLLKKLASFPRQNELALALREVGRLERSKFMIEWVLDEGLQFRAQAGLNKGESHHALKNALRIGRQGEIRDRTQDARHFRIAGLNLLAAIVIYWNTARMSEGVEKYAAQGIDIPADHLSHLSPLGWAHIQLTGEYKWDRLTQK